MTYCSRVIVFGAAHEDLYLRVTSLPDRGETVLATRRSTGLGGKGANQAVAAATGGAPTTLVAAVGSDPIGSAIRQRLVESRIDTSMITSPDGSTSGLAVVTVDDRGENQIVVASGSGADLDPSVLTGALNTVRPGDVVVLQCEIPREAVELVAVGAAGRGAVVVLNLAPFASLASAAMAAASVIVVNRSEAAALSGLTDGTTGGELARAAAARAGTLCLVTLGEDGAVLADPTEVLHVVSAEKVRVVDTTGAGDSFVGALAAELAAGSTISASMTTASRAAAWTVQHQGAQPNPPHPPTTATEQVASPSTEGASR